MVELGRVAHSHIPIECIAVSSAFTFPGDVSSLDEIGDDSLRRPLSDTDRVGDIANPYAGVALDTEEHLGVVREEVPAF